MPEEIKERYVCDVCGEPAVVRDSENHWFCYPHHRLRLTVAKFEQVVELHKKGIDSIPDTVAAR